MLVTYKYYSMQMEQTGTPHEVTHRKADIVKYQAMLSLSINISRKGKTILKCKTQNI